MVKMYSLYKLFELKFIGNTSEEKYEEKYAATLGTKAKQLFFLKKISAITLKNMSNAQKFNFAYRAYGKRSR